VTPSPPPPAGSPAHIALGETYACATTYEGTVRCWGANIAFSRGGDGGAADWTVATPVPGLDAVVRLAAGAVTACALRSDGTVRCWGYYNGQPGGGLQLAQIPGLPSAEAIAVGGTQACALTHSGDLWCWGDAWWSEQHWGIWDTEFPCGPDPRTVAYGA